jgi:hypothetical protein
MGFVWLLDRGREITARIPIIGSRFKAAAPALRPFLPVDGAGPVSRIVISLIR